MSNPYFSNSKIFGDRRPAVDPDPGRAQRPNQAQGPWGQRPAAGQATAPAPGYDQQFAGVEQSFYGPSAGSMQTGRMTYDDVIMKSVGVGRASCRERE